MRETEALKLYASYGSRTHDLLLRRQSLYPAELRKQLCFSNPEYLTNNCGNVHLDNSLSLSQAFHVSRLRRLYFVERRGRDRTHLREASGNCEQLTRIETNVLISTAHTNEHKASSSVGGTGGTRRTNKVWHTVGLQPIDNLSGGRTQRRVATAAVPDERLQPTR